MRTLVNSSWAWFNGVVLPPNVCSSSRMVFKETVMSDCLIIAAIKLETATLAVAHVLMWSDAHGNSQRSHLVKYSGHGMITTVS